MIKIDVWMEEITDKLKKAFKENLIFIGLQGSYNRGEAAAESDIDVVVILDKLNFEDLETYKKVISTMPDNDKICGFISGKEELCKWSKPDLFQFFYETQSVFGNLSEIIQAPGVEDIKIAVKTGSETLYHSAVHSFLHSKEPLHDLQNLYKTVFFILQAKYFIENNVYLPTKNMLKENLKGEDLELLDICIERKNLVNLNEKEVNLLYSKIINWSSKNI